jgi:hypothetical protein
VNQVMLRIVVLIMIFIFFSLGGEASRPAPNSFSELGKQFF